MNDFANKPIRRYKITRHAIDQYIARFAGNVSAATASQRLEAIARKARRKRPAPGGATIYKNNGLELVIKNKTIITIYNADTRPDGYAVQA